LADLHRIARLHVGLATGDHLITDRETLRRDDIGLLTILIFHERDEGRTIGIIFQPLDGRGLIPFAPLEIDDAVFLLVAAGDATRRGVAHIVAAAGLALAFGER